MDEASDRFETPRLQKNRNSKYKYELNHDLFVNSYIAENLQYSSLKIKVYCKLFLESKRNRTEKL